MRLSSLRGFKAVESYDPETTRRHNTGLEGPYMMRLGPSRVSEYKKYLGCLVGSVALE